MDNIILIGMKHVGKTTTALELKEILGWDLVVLDGLVESLYKELNGENKNCRQIAAEHGIEYFRSLETQVLESLQCQKAIIDTGGGILETEANIPLLKKMGKIVCITLDPDVNFAYIIERGIPSFYDSENPRKTFNQLLAKRMNQYQACADLIVDATAKEYSQVAKEIVQEL